MKKNLLLLVAIIGSVFILASVASATISGSDHDFNKDAANGELCIACHTPHDAGAAAGAPLWNQAVTQETFTPYSSNTLNADASGGPSGTSKLCLSCHDGATTIDVKGATMGGSEVIGIDLSNDHPISITYNDALATADGGLNPPTTTNSSLGDTIDVDMLFGTADNGTVECASCHDVHDDAGNSSLLRIANAGSDLCLTCHNK